VLDAHAIICSMSRRGNCHDNAVMESFFSTVKAELREHFDSCGEAKWSCSTTSKCSITNGAGIRRSPRRFSLRKKNVEQLKQRSYFPVKK
jgi:transposase InsO family protein